MGEEGIGGLPDMGDTQRWQILWQRCDDQDSGCGLAARRQQMVEAQIRGREIMSPPVLRALAKVPRHLFVRPEDEEHAYEDRPLVIGEGQTISQPYMVALMTQLLHLRPYHRVLEVGTGSGYQAAVLAEIVSEVYSIELSERLAVAAQRRITTMGYKNIHLRCGDGYCGWSEEAPYDGIIVTCAAEKLPRPLLNQLADGGRLVIPIGPRWTYQLLWVMERRGERIESRQVGKVAFVPFRRPKDK